MPQLIWPLLKKNVDSSSSENRTLASKPVFTLDTYKDYSSDYESYFNDNLPFRNILISLNSHINYFLFNSSSNDSVLIGKNGWLFYSDSEDGNPAAYYRGKYLYSEEQLQDIASNLVNIEKYLAEYGIEFIVFVAPNKERIYSEMMPDYYGEPAETYAALQVVNYIRNNTDIRIVYPYEELICAKNQLGEIPIYHKVDTHWNYVGGYIGAAALLKELGINMPEITSSEITISPIKNSWSDLASMLNLSNELQNSEYDYNVTGYNNHDAINEKWDFLTEIIYHSQNADPRKIYIVRDSFCSAMSGYIGSQFNNSYMVGKIMYSNANLLEQSPDIFVLESVERYISELGKFSIY